LAHVIGVVSTYAVPGQPEQVRLLQRPIIRGTGQPRCELGYCQGSRVGQPENAVLTEPEPMPPRVIFLQACNEVAAQLDGFRVLQKGQTLKKHSPDKSIECQIHFQANRRNFACDITTQVHFSLHSKALQKWQAAHGSPHVSGCLGRVKQAVAPTHRAA